MMMMIMIMITIMILIIIIINNNDNNKDNDDDNFSSFLLAPWRFMLMKILNWWFSSLLKARHTRHSE